MLNIKQLQVLLSIEEIQEVEILDKGFSDDSKYVVKTSRDKFLLRLTSIKNKARMLQMISLLKQAKANNIRTHQVIDHGEFSETQYYLLTTWIEGRDLEVVLPTLSKEKQYEIGLQAGEILRHIHDFEMNLFSEDRWENRFNKKIDKKIKAYEECDIKFENGDLFIEAVESRRYLLKDSPIVQHHGDFHVGNLLINDKGQIYIIDFDRHDTGDPYEEFNRIVWCAGVSSYFASGRVDGYFNNNIPSIFWDLLILYISNNTLSSLPWAVPFGDKQIEVMKVQAKQILTWYDNFNTYIPSWYIS
ncbi:MULTISPECIES: aminoglycoside phosphotransferase family protein [Jeotgalicoccus]|uniref:aminoglycoside phosphotransferase family protein n=1 Tax=Jeotgalicoccus TaxID=227979 RepID=UPI0004292255|nr:MULTISPECIES: aminoglycoside phosphotransferase family protein [Jeotgalicoccus]QQD85168.1 aminoglycoside phosphotransferase family protein [Jeotgalicoccus sp. ATCC 8456]